MFPKTKRTSESSVRLQTRIKKVFYHLSTWLSIRWTSLGELKQHLETIKFYLRENKTKLFSEILFHWYREKLFRLRIAINIWWSLGEPMYDIQNYRTFIEQFWKQNYFLKSSFLPNSLWKRWFKFFLIHVKFAVNVLASPKTTHLKTSKRFLLFAENNYFLKTSIVRKFKSKRWLYTFDI